MSRYEKTLIDELRCIARKNEKDINREDFKTVAEGLAELLDLFDSLNSMLKLQDSMYQTQTVMRGALALLIDKERFSQESPPNTPASSA